MDVPVGRMVYTAMLNRRGGFESDLTVMRLAADRFLVVTGSAQPNRDMDWLQRHGADAHVSVTDVSALWCVLSLMGPRSRELLARVSPDDLSPAGLKFAHTKEIDLGLARVRAARMSYVGGPGFELYVPCEMARHVYLTLQDAGADLGLADGGYYALDALRIEAGRRAWGAELGPDETPWMAGLDFAVQLDKGSDFIGRDALVAARAAPLGKKLLAFVLDAPHARTPTWLWGGEPILLDGTAAGELSSAGFSIAAGRCIGLGYVRGEAALRTHAGSAATLEVWGEPVAARAWDDMGAALKPLTASAP
jgi:4-methylaminobutanoate oxidase (formaldehyde-forming)